MSRKVLGAVALVLVLLVVAATRSQACTGLTVKSKDGAMIFARTLEFAIDLKSNIAVIPRNLDIVGSTPDGSPGLKWTSKHGVVGTNAFNLPIVIDGLNEKGLHIGVFYFPGYAKFQEVEKADYAKVVAPWELPLYLLTTCSTIDEAVSATKQVIVANVVQSDMGICPPCHYVINDPQGKSIVIEYVDGKLNFHDNPLGVMSNAPTFDWHMTNLSNYVNMRIDNIPSVKLGDFDVKGFGEGSGMLGLPGDFTPPSRFIRAAIYSKSALPADTAEHGVLQAFHLLNQFDIPRGVARGEANGETVADYTLWTDACDLTNRRLYFRTFNNSRIRMVDLNEINFDMPKWTSISMSGDEVIEDLTGKATGE